MPLILYQLSNQKCLMNIWKGLAKKRIRNDYWKNVEDAHRLIESAVLVYEFLEVLENLLLLPGWNYDIAYLIEMCT